MSLALSTAFVAAVPAALAAEPDAWDSRDMKLHFGAGFMIGTAVTTITESPHQGVLAGVTIGVLKEIADSGPLHHSTGDALATAVGALAGSYVTGLIVKPGAVWYQFEW